MMNELALFAGAGGGLLGSILLGWRTVCAVEINAYSREILLRRQEDGALPCFPIWDNARTFDGHPWAGKVDIVTAGFPCQPWSCAGKRQGEADERNLWPDTIRIIREVGPRFALLENVPGLLSTSYWGTILGDLAESGFDVRWRVLSAAEVGAPHKRDRVWILAYDPSQRAMRLPVRPRRTRQASLVASGLRENVANAECDRRERGKSAAGTTTGMRRRSAVQGTEVADANPMGRRFAQASIIKSDETAFGGRCASWWATESAVGRVADGVAHRVDRLRALGEGQVPAVVRAAWELLSLEE